MHRRCIGAWRIYNRRILLTPLSYHPRPRGPWGPETYHYFFPQLSLLFLPCFAPCPSLPSSPWRGSCRTCRHVPSPFNQTFSQLRYSVLYFTYSFLSMEFNPRWTQILLAQITHSKLTHNLSITHQLYLYFNKILQINHQPLKRGRILFLSSRIIICC